jgi:uncharacterized protein
MFSSVRAVNRLPIVFLALLAAAVAAAQGPRGINPRELALARAGNPVDEWFVGLAYEKGDGVPQDYTKAAEWYRKSAEQGNVRGQTLLAALYENGQGVPKDYAESASWYRKAADQGNISSCWFLGSFYQFGKGVAKDPTQAAFWYRKDAESGDPDSEDSLGLLYEEGRGVPQDFSEAYFWTSLAAAISDGHDDGKSFPSFAQDRDRVAARLTSSELSKVQARTQVWFNAKHP